jgi:hypothetical protein
MPSTTIFIAPLLIPLYETKPAQAGLLGRVGIGEEASSFLFGFDNLFAVVVPAFRAYAVGKPGFAAVGT